MANNGAVTKTLNAGGSYTIPAGYHNGSGKVTVASLSSQTSATATAGQILTGKTAWVNGSKITGTMANRGTLKWAPTTGTTYTVPAGYYSGGTLDSSGAYNAGYSAGESVGSNQSGVTVVAFGQLNEISKTVTLSPGTYTIYALNKDYYKYAPYAYVNVNGSRVFTTTTTDDLDVHYEAKTIEITSTSTVVVAASGGNYNSGMCWAMVTITKN